MKKVYANEDVCIGCKLCEVHCIVAHSKYPDNLIKAFKKQPHLKARVVVEEQRPISFAVQCRHCEEPLCTKACITGAMQKDPKTGAVINETERCVGCWTCILACPYGAIVREEFKKKVAAKCDLCMGTNKGEPACVANCPNKALRYEEA